ncbi:NADH-quinone oxidoreductase subunit C, partial [Streptomyces sp. PSKA30]|nr:NADH-quinone oxidoreductase subunit C [Streptomyces sp. PSKA30]
PASTPAESPRRARSASEGSASQRATDAAAGPRRARSASEGSASQRAEGADAEQTRPDTATPRSSDAPWHHARPAFDEREEKDTEQTPNPEDPAGGRQ